MDRSGCSGGAGPPLSVDGGQLGLTETSDPEILARTRGVQQLWNLIDPAIEHRIQAVAQQSLMLSKEADAATLKYERFARDQTSRLAPSPRNRETDRPPLLEPLELDSGERIALFHRP